MSQGTTRIADIFISYSRKDQETARNFVRAIEAAGHSVWWDTELRAGETFDKVIEAALEKAQAVVVLWSPDSVESKWVRAEATHAEHNGTYLPCMIAPCSLPIIFRMTHTADLSRWGGESDAAEWQAFMSALDRHLAGNSDSDEPHQRALEASASHRTPRGRPVLALQALELLGDDAKAVGEDFGLGLLEEFETVLDRFHFVVEARRRASDADYALEGTMRIANGQVRLAMRLKDARSGRRLWAERYETALESSFEAQENLAGTIISHVADMIGEVEAQNALGKPLETLSPYHLMVSGLRFIREFDRQSLEKAISHFDAGLNLTPDDPYLNALGSLARGLQLYFLFDVDREETRNQTLTLFNRAVRLASDDAQVLSWASMGGRSAGADLATLDAMMDRAVERNRHYAYIWHFSAFVKMSRGDLDEGFKRASKSLELEPRSWDRWAVLIAMAVPRFVEGKFEEAQDFLMESNVLLPNNPEAMIILSCCYFKLGQIEEAEKLWKQLGKRDPYLILGQHGSHYRDKFEQAIDEVSAHMASRQA